MFKDRLWTPGELVTVDPGEFVSRHFQPVVEQVLPVEEVLEDVRVSKYSRKRKQ